LLPRRFFVCARKMQCWFCVLIRGNDQVARKDSARVILFAFAAKSHAIVPKPLSVTAHAPAHLREGGAGHASL